MCHMPVVMTTLHLFDGVALTCTRNYTEQIKTGFIFIGRNGNFDGSNVRFVSHSQCVGVGGSVLLFMFWLNAW